jgi:hypothetical protein
LFTVITYRLEIYYTNYIKTVILFKLLFLIAIFSFRIKWKNLINLLLSIETFILIFIYYTLLYFIEFRVFYLVVIIIIREAVLGLSLLIINIRFFGNDFTNNFMWFFKI